MSILTNGERAELGLGQMQSVSETILNNASTQPCGCPECDENIQHGHFACSTSEAVLLQFEREGYLTRHYNSTSWVWERTEKRLRSEMRAKGS